MVGAHICTKRGYASNMSLQKSRADREPNRESNFLVINRFAQLSLHVSTTHWCPLAHQCLYYRSHAGSDAVFEASHWYHLLWSVKHTTPSCSEGRSCVFGGSPSEPLPSKSPMVFPKQLLGLTITEIFPQNEWSVCSYTNYEILNVKTNIC